MLGHENKAFRAHSATTPPSVDYALTVLGEEFIPAIRAIVDVGSKLHRSTSDVASCAA